MGIRGLPNFNPADRRFWPKDPDPNFSPERNKKVIEETIKEYEAKRARELKKFEKGLAERTDAVASYLTGRYGAYRSTPLERYFGKRYLAKLRGEKIVEKLKRIGDPRLSSLRRKVWNEEGMYLGNPSDKKEK